MGCAHTHSQSRTLQLLETLWDDQHPEGGEEMWEKMSRTESERRCRDWSWLGGDQLEQPLREGWVRLVRASWLLKLAEYGGVLRRRQDMPHKAFVGLDELKAAGPFDDPVNGESWLRIIVVSHPWLELFHPDPHGENLRVIAKGLKLFIEKDLVMDHVDPGEKPYGVLIDWTALFQEQRTDLQNTAFESGLYAMNLFYSHPRTLVFQVTHLSVLHRVAFGHNTAVFAERGWCFAESAMSGLVKKSHMVLDLSHLGARNASSFDLMRRCKAKRAPPLCPDSFKAELDKKSFTSKTDDFSRVVKLYSGAFELHLAGAQELDYSGLGWGPGEMRVLLQALRSNNCLKKLDLEGNRMGPEAAADLGEVLRNNTSLQVLNLWQNGIGPVGVTALGEALKGNTSLHTLHLPQNHIDSAGAAALGEMLRFNTSLQTLNLRRNDIGPEGDAAFWEALQSSSLQMLELGYNNISSAGAEALGEALQSNTSLGALILNDNCISSEGASALGGALRSNTTLQTLNLRQNNIGPEGAVALCEALQSNASLHGLDLGHNDIGGVGAAAMSEALRSNSSLQTLDLDSANISPTGGAALGEALGKNTSLHTLNLKDNNVSSAGATALGAALRSNATLQSLTLESNSIGSEGAVALGEALRSNTTLRALDLDSDDIGSAGAAALGDALQTNTTLIELWLRLNDIGLEGAVALRKGLCSNSTLRVLNLRGNPISQDGAARLVEACPLIQVYSDYRTHIPQARSREASASSRESPRPFGLSYLSYQILQEEWTI